MGALFSCLNPPENCSRPLLEKNEGGASASASSSSSAYRTSVMSSYVVGDPTHVKALPPKFISPKKAASKRAAGAAASRTTSGIFCRCGGPGSLVQLLPCKCYALCLMCAQAEVACPDCGVSIVDSIPSWKIL